MKRINLLLCITGTLFYSSFLNAQAWTLIPPNDVYRPNKVGIGFNSAPSLGLSLEVDGPIGFSYGNFLGVRGLSSGQNKLIECAWDGANNFDYLAFYTAGTNSANNGEKMRITMMGKFSLGAGANPLAKFDVYEQTALGGTQNNTMLLSRMGGNCGSGSLSHNQWLVRHTNGNGSATSFVRDGISMDANNMDASMNNCDVRTWWSRDANGDVQTWGTGVNTYMVLSQGKVGIGNMTPGALLDVKGTSNSYASIQARAYHSADYGYAITANVQRDLTKAFTIINENYNNSASLKETFTVYGNGTTKIGIKSQNTGNHTDALLQVYGKALATEVIVTQSNWADFVFNENYKLMPLSKLEEYYKENHHLPQIPSVEEIIKDGNDLGKTDALLLQKVEELTLYIVELKKEIDALKQEKR